MPAHRKIVEELESPTAVYIGIMKHNGVPMDVELMEKRKEEVEAEMETLRGQIAFIIGDAVVEFLGISEMNDKRYMHIHMSDTDRYSFPVATAPIFQKTDTKRP